MDTHEQANSAEQALMILRELISSAQRLMRLDHTAVDEYRRQLTEISKLLPTLEIPSMVEDQDFVDSIEEQKYKLKVQIYEKNKVIKSLIDQNPFNASCNRQCWLIISGIMWDLKQYVKKMDFQNVLIFDVTKGLSRNYDQEGLKE